MGPADTNEQPSSPRERGVTVKIPAYAITGTGNRTRAYLTEREAVALVTADGYTPRDVTDLLAADHSFGLSTGAKIARVTPWQRGKISTRARVWQVYGYHYAGTDVTSLIHA
jgi:hypothetical protein